MNLHATFFAMWCEAGTVHFDGPMTYDQLNVYLLKRIQLKGITFSEKLPAYNGYVPAMGENEVLVIEGKIVQPKFDVPTI